MDSPPEWYDPMQAAYWRMTRQIEQEFLTGVDDMGIRNAKAKGRLTPPKLTHRAAGRLKFVEVAAEVKRATIVYVAVIVRQGFANSDSLWRFASGRSDDGWFALIGDDKKALITEALAKARSFGSSQKYEVVVGTLDEMVVIPSFFEVVKL